jgi:hypothetical protein
MPLPNVKMIPSNVKMKSHYQHKGTVKNVYVKIVKMNSYYFCGNPEGIPIVVSLSHGSSRSCTGTLRTRH